MLESPLTDVVDHVELDRAQIAEQLHRDLQVKQRLLVLSEELALHIKFTHTILRNLNGVGLSVSHTRLGELPIATKTRNLKLLKDGIISSIVINTLKLDILAILAQRCSESVVSTEFRNRELKLLHEKSNYLINSLVNN